jgi:hypothetical protein
MAHPITPEAVVARVAESGDFEEIARSVMTELKRAGELLHAEDDFSSCIAQSFKDGKLAQVVVGAPTELQKQKKRAEVKKEIEKRLGNLAQIERKIQKTAESSWINDFVHDYVHNAAKALQEESEAKAAKPMTSAKQEEEQAVAPAPEAEQPDAKKIKTE